MRCWLAPKKEKKIAMSTSSRQLFNVCDKLTGQRKSSPLPSEYPLHDLPNVFNDYFLRKSSLFVLILISSHCHCRALTNCRLTDQQAASNFHSFHPITEAELKATILKSKPTSCSLDPLPTITPSWIYWWPASNSYEHHQFLLVVWYFSIDFQISCS